MQSDPREADAERRESAAPDHSEPAGVPEPRGAEREPAPDEDAPAASPVVPPEIEHHPEEERIREDIIGVLRTIYDPEIPVNIYDIGLIYAIDVDTESRAYVTMTLTSPMCPVAGSLPGEVEVKVAGAPGVSSARVELVWDPPWGIDKMSESARLQLNL